jgi:predicted DNA-binding mobile mystery protein A
MNAKQRKLAREQLDERLKKFKTPSEITPPAKGWVRAIRDALGMSGRQLANRIGVNQQRIARIEQDEKLGKVKLETLEKVAQALDCKFVYGFVPNKSLDNTVKNQAIVMAKRLMSRTNQTMRLEMQELSDNDKDKALKDLTADIIYTMPRSLWNKE